MVSSTDTSAAGDGSDIKTIDEEILKTRYTMTIGRDGGVRWEDPFEIQREGPISRIELRHGSEIDSIRVFYGGVPGRKHGGNGGGEGAFEVNPHYQIFRIDGRAGARVDQLQFIARLPDGTGKVQTSPVFGGHGGTPNEIVGPSGLALRSISGRAGSRIDQLSFHFGYLVKIDNVQVDREALEKSVQGATLKVLDSAEYNNGTDIDTSSTFERTLTISDRTTVQWSGTTKFLFGVSVTAKATVGLAETGATTTFQFEQSFNYGSSNEKTTTEQIRWSTNFPAPAQKRSVITVFVYEKEVSDVPFTYDIVLYEILDDVEVVHTRAKRNGTFSGIVTSRTVNATVKTYPIPSDHFAKVEKAALAG